MAKQNNRVKTFRFSGNNYTYYECWVYGSVFRCNKKTNWDFAVYYLVYDFRIKLSVFVLFIYPSG